MSDRLVRPSKQLPRARQLRARRRCPRCCGKRTDSRPERVVVLDPPVVLPAAVADVDGLGTRQHEEAGQRGEARGRLHGVRGLLRSGGRKKGKIEAGSEALRTRAGIQRCTGVQVRQVPVPGARCVTTTLPKCATGPADTRRRRVPHSPPGLPPLGSAPCATSDVSRRRCGSCSVRGELAGARKERSWGAPECASVVACAPGCAGDAVQGACGGVSRCFESVRNDAGRGLTWGGGPQNHSWPQGARAKPRSPRSARGQCIADLRIEQARRPADGCSGRLALADRSFPPVPARSSPPCTRPRAAAHLPTLTTHPRVIPFESEGVTWCPGAPSRRRSSVASRMGEGGATNEFRARRPWRRRWRHGGWLYVSWCGVAGRRGG